MGDDAISEAAYRCALERTWWPVARSVELDQPQQAQLLDRKLAVFRGSDGNAHVVDDRCPHRGASLSRGETLDNAIQCPYHGWQWDGASGRCINIPSLSDQDRIPGGARVKAHVVQERWGLVWTCLAGEPARGIPDPEWLSDFDWMFDVGVSDVTANVLFVQENFRDVGHFAFVHKDTIPVSSPVVHPLEVTRDGFELRCAVAVPYVADEHSIWDSKADTTMRYHAIVPGFASIMAGDCPSPVSLEQTRTFYVNGVTPDLAGDLPGMVASEARVYAEDREIVGDIEPRRLGAPLMQVHTIADTYTLAFRQAFRDYVRLYGTLTAEHATPA
jgi:nitrite reductase/ring-hydroxylating ferredoxin subunit